MLNSATIPCMAKKSKAVGRPPKEENQGLIPLYIEISPRLKLALKGLADTEDRTLRAQISRLLVEGLTNRGLWDKEPPPEK